MGTSTFLWVLTNFYHTKTFFKESFKRRQVTQISHWTVFPLGTTMPDVKVFINADILQNLDITHLLSASWWLFSCPPHPQAVLKVRSPAALLLPDVVSQIFTLLSHLLLLHTCLKQNFL